MKFLPTLALLIPMLVNAAPDITGEQIKYDTDTIQWPKNIPVTAPDLEGGANLINDLNVGLKHCELFFPTAGNYNRALGQYFYGHFLIDNPHLNNYVYITSPPVVKTIAESGQFVMGNFKTTCRPSLTVGPGRLMDTLEAAGLTVGSRIPIIKNQGNAIIVKKGNPHNVTGVFDLGFNGINLVTSDLDTEPGSGNNYANSIFDIAEADRGTARATILFNQIYNNDTVNGGKPNYISWGPILKNSRLCHWVERLKTLIHCQVTA